MFIADFHIHSKYSRATSGECIPEVLDLWARRKGLGLIGTGDFTHPAWREELKSKLVVSEEGLYTLKDECRREDSIAGGSFKPRFIVSGEISSIYKKNGKVRKVHNLILLPGLEKAEALAHRLEAIGNLHSDGRPILGLDSRDLLEITLDVCPESIFIPAHIWTPHFSLFGAYSGFDDIKECFEDLTGQIYTLETGLSSDPPMNWRLSALDRFTLVSNSDAHSPANLAREANLFDTALSFPHISQALQNRDSGEFRGTIEFFPEEGKYHYDGHRNCKVCLKPQATRDAGGLCPVCGGKLTVGVLHRVEELADRNEGFKPANAPHFESLIPLMEVIADSLGSTTASLKTREKYDDLIRNLGTELFILREAPLADIETRAGTLVAEGIRKLRSGKVEVMPGYDGEYGKIKILDKSEINRLFGQMGFSDNQEQKISRAKDRPKPLKASRENTVPQSLSDMPMQVTETKIGTADNSKVLSRLNPEQQEAVTASEKVVAVIAGPGTGKTKTLVSRIAYLIHDCGVPPSEIMAVTFTNRAAGEMRTRLIEQLEDEQTVKGLITGTFHSICLHLLSGLNEKPNITVIDEAEALSVVEEILNGFELKNSPRDILRGISLKKCGAQLSDEKTLLPPLVYELYCNWLKRYGVLDYDDILLDALKIEDNKIPHFSHILVDEFQDINATQYQLIKKWGKNRAGIFVIGDPDQSIYGFRGSDSQCFQRLTADFPDTRQVRLSLNYRSSPEIIRCSLSVIAKQTAEKSTRRLEATRKNGARVRLLEANDDFSEAVFVSKEINRMVGGVDMLEAHKSNGTKKKNQGSIPARGLSDIAVLYRTHRQARILEQCFQKEGIPYVVIGRDEFMTDPDVRKSIAFFRYLLNPADLVSLRICLKEFNVGGAEITSEILKSYAASEKSIGSLSAIINTRLLISSPGYPVKLVDLLNRYEPIVRREKPRILVESWINDNGLNGRVNMEMLLNTAVLHEEMPAFLQTLLLGRESDIVRSGGKNYTTDAVSLMTLHGAKGLEFPVVYICGVQEGIIPWQNRNGESNLEEERRLFYVGMTRAQDQLLLIAPGEKSQFLAGLPEDSLTIEKVYPGRKSQQFEQLSLFDE